jgi:hypothetical protein
MERRISPGTESAGAPLLSQELADDMLLRDVDLLRFLGGDYDQVTAMRAGQPPTGLTRVSVTLAGDKLPPAAWSIAGTTADSGWRLTASGSDTVATLYNQSGALSLKMERSGAPSAEADETGDNAGHEFDPFLSVLDFHADAAGDNSAASNWVDATRTFEIVDATHRSIARRRTIDLHFETPSERMVFKTQMTAIGCGVLTFTLLGLVLYLLVAGLFPINANVLSIARIVWLLPLLLFLLLQLLLFVARPSAARSNSRHHNVGDSDD